MLQRLNKLKQAQARNNASKAQDGDDPSRHESLGADWDGHMVAPVSPQPRSPRSPATGSPTGRLPKTLDRGQRMPSRNSNTPSSKLHSRELRDVDSMYSRNSNGRNNNIAATLADLEEPVLGAVSRHYAVSRKVWDKYTQNAPDADLNTMTRFRQQMPLRYTFSTFYDQPSGIRMRRATTDLENGNSDKEKEQDVPRSIFYLPSINPHSHIALLWSYLMLFMDGVYTAFIVPISSAFFLDKTDVHPFAIIDLIAGCIFAINLVMGFQTGLILSHDYKKKLLMDGKLIAGYYIKQGSFWIDAVAVVPTAIYIIAILCEIGSPTFFNAITFLLLTRLLRLFWLLRLLYIGAFTGTLPAQLSAYMSIFGLYAAIMIYTVALIVNMLACLAYLVASLEGLQHSWLNNLDFFPEAIHQGKVYHYVLCLYWTLTTVTNTGYGDITPKQIGETFVAMTMQLAGVTMIALLVGSISEIVTQVTADARKAASFREKLTQVNDWMNKRNLPKRLRKQINAYYGEVWLKHQEHPVEASIFKELPNALRMRVGVTITKALVRSVRVFHGVEDDALELISSRIVPVEVPPGHDLCREGEAGSCLWILQDGHMMALRQGKELDMVAGPCLLGSSIILADDVDRFRFRPVTFSAVSACRLWELPLRELKQLFHLCPYLHDQLLEGLKANLLARLRHTGDGQWSELLVQADMGKPDFAADEALADKLEARSHRDGSMQQLLAELRKGRLIHPEGLAHAASVPVHAHSVPVHAATSPAAPNKLPVSSSGGALGRLSGALEGVAEGQGEASDDDGGDDEGHGDGGRWADHSWAGQGLATLSFDSALRRLEGRQAGGRQHELQ